MVWKSRRDESLQSPDTFWETKELFGNWLDDQIVIFRPLRAEGGPKCFPEMNEFNDLTKFFNCFADILYAVNLKHAFQDHWQQRYFPRYHQRIIFFLEVLPFENTLPEKILFPVFSYPIQKR